MCPYPGQINMEYVHDLHRGRAYDQVRFSKIFHFAYRRWDASRDLRQAGKWLKVMESVQRRAPHKIHQ